jgi:ATP-dependent DNA helicase Rep/DNA helicase-2/ATP-dependent DNA helicase PcrA
MKTPPYIEAAEELRPNKEQWRAYESAGNCVVLAGPGSGKTKVITIKIARLLDEHVRRPQRLGCITYSNTCVSELVARLRKLGVADDERLLISTVHSFCLTELVVPFAKLAGVEIPDPFTVASPAKSRQVFEEAYGQTLGGKPPGWFRIEFEKVRRSIPDRDSSAWKNWPGRETEVVEVYEDLLLNKYGLIDFDGLVLSGLKLVEEHEFVRRCVVAKFPVLVIDEYQDLGVPLHRIVVGLLSKAGVRIVAVGDPDQSIYGFTGAQPGLLRELAARPDVENVVLKLNYRCADQIIAASKSLLSDPGDFKSHDGRKGDIFIYETERDVKGQALYALNTVLPELLDKNKQWKLGDIAVLYWSFNEGTAVAKAADALELRYFRADSGAPVKRSRLIEWLTEAAKWCAGGWSSGTVSLGHLLKSWRLMRRSLNREAAVLAARAQLIKTLFAHRDGNIPLHVWLLTLQKNALGDIFAEEPGLVDEKDNFDALLSASKDGALKDYSVEVFGNQGRSPEQINLMNLHNCKGLEFETVFIVGLEEGVFPSNRDNTQEKVEEKMRLFYVGITRAKSIVHLMYGLNPSPFISIVREATEG